MAELRLGALPEQALTAAAEFHAKVLPGVLALLNPPPLGEVASRSDDGGGDSGGQTPSASLRSAPPPAGEDIVLIFPPADYTHRAWRLAAVQALARDHAPIRVNALVSNSEPAIAAALAYIGTADGVTGQLLELDDTGAGEVVSSPA